LLLAGRRAAAVVSAGSSRTAQAAPLGVLPRCPAEQAECRCLQRKMIVRGETVRHIDRVLCSSQQIAHEQPATTVQ
jgi:hypothetical protein